MKKTGKKRPADEFSTLLLKWNKENNKREMPWKGEKDPYRIWLSEVILQQTRVDQGLAYYERFVEKFPTIKDLASAADTTVFKLWEGLGYYSRCKNLLETARFISNDLKGVFPNSYDDIRSLKGIGPYTAAAISSFAYDLPYAVVDGNVFRVLSRVFGIDTPIDSTEGKKYFTQLADDLLDRRKPGIYNQAIMDFGAIICKPALPACPVCIFKKDCSAYLENRIDELPVKEKKISIKKRWFYYLMIEYKDRIAIRQRTGKDIWNQLYEFPVIETTSEHQTSELIDVAEKQQWIPPEKYSLSFVSTLFKQKLSHQLISGRFIAIKIRKPGKLPEGTVWVSKEEMGNYPFPKFINQFLEKQKEADHTLF